MKINSIKIVLGWIGLASCCLPIMSQPSRLVDYVNPFVGTDGYGNVYPGAQIPFGGIQMRIFTMRLRGTSIIIHPSSGLVLRILAEPVFLI